LGIIKNSISLRGLGNLVLSSMVIILGSCKQESSFDCLKRTGKIITEIRGTSNFTAIEIYNNMPVYLVQDSTCFIEVKGGENLLSEVVTTVSNNKLTIKNLNRCNFSRSYTSKIYVTIHFNELNDLIYRGTGPVTGLNTMVNDTFTFNCYDGVDTVKLMLDVPLIYANIHTGVADLIVSGKAKQLYAYAKSSGTFRMQQLICSNVYSNNISSSDHFFYAEDKIEALVQYVGNTYCYGLPKQIIKTENNTGKLFFK
jgi:hypothetical protein